MSLRGTQCPDLFVEWGEGCIRTVDMKSKLCSIASKGLLCGACEEVKMGTESGRQVSIPTPITVTPFSPSLHVGSVWKIFI